MLHQFPSSGNGRYVRKMFKQNGPSINDVTASADGIKDLLTVGLRDVIYGRPLKIKVGYLNQAQSLTTQLSLETSSAGTESGIGLSGLSAVKLG